MNKKIIIGIGCLILLSGLAYVLSKRPETSQQAPTNLANPASVNCKNVGGTTQIMTGPNGQYGLCNFEDNQACEEWALFKGVCPVGGVKTTGFDTIEQKYCAWLGAQTLAVSNAACTLPGGKVCPADALYKGSCPAN